MVKKTGIIVEENDGRMMDLQTRRYEVALSYASEQRKYVGAVSKALDKWGVSHFFDSNEKVVMWGRELGEFLNNIFSKQAGMYVIFISKDYKEKMWCVHERRSIMEPYLRDFEQVRVLPIKFDNTELPGYPSTICYLKRSEVSPSKLSEMIYQKVTIEGFVQPEIRMIVDSCNNVIRHPEGGTPSDPQINAIYTILKTYQYLNDNIYLKRRLTNLITTTLIDGSMHGGTPGNTQRIVQRLIISFLSGNVLRPKDIEKGIRDEIE